MAASISSAWPQESDGRRRDCANWHSSQDFQSTALCGNDDWADRDDGAMMAEVISFEPGGYRYIKGVFQYSAGVAAEPGYEIVRARFARPLPLREGFAAIEAHLQSKKRPT